MSLRKDVLIQEISTTHTPESLVEQLGNEPGVVLLRSLLFDSAQAHYSFVAARPFLVFRCWGSRCELRTEGRRDVQFGNPWRLLDSLMSRFELLEELDLPFPLGGCFGYWGYDLKNFVEPKLARRPANELELPDCHVGFYDSLVVFDHRIGKTWIVSTGLHADGSRTERRAIAQMELWRENLNRASDQSRNACNGALGTDAPYLSDRSEPNPRRVADRRALPPSIPQERSELPIGQCETICCSNLSRAEFLAGVQRAQTYIHAGDIYQVNLSQRLAARWPFTGWEMFQRLSAVSPAPFSAFLDGGDFQIASSSPELFLRLSGAHIETGPIKGTRPRSPDPTRDAQLTYELQTSPKEIAELVMITDLLRNDLGKVCEFGSVQVPELVRLERYAQVQHLVSTVEGRLRGAVSHFGALASCFPGGSVTGAPKFRAMEIIDELEPVNRGPYTGALGYLGFNRESQLSIIIRAAVCTRGHAYFHAGAGIVADSIAEAEYEETLAKARGFLEALQLQSRTESRLAF
jgi:para-aminobenzoate synthetase component 1